MKQRIAAWIARHFIADDPMPELSRLDVMDRPQVVLRTADGQPIQVLVDHGKEFPLNPNMDIVLVAGQSNRPID